jgi:hypothetical protein
MGVLSVQVTGVESHRLQPKLDQQPKCLRSANLLGCCQALYLSDQDWRHSNCDRAWRRIMVAHPKALAVWTLKTNRFRVFSTTNQNDFGIVSFRIG